MHKEIEFRRVENFFDTFLLLKMIINSKFHKVRCVTKHL